MAKPSKTLLLLARETHDTVKPEGANLAAAIMCVRDKSSVLALRVKFFSLVRIVNQIDLMRLPRFRFFWSIDEGELRSNEVFEGFDDVHILFLSSKSLGYS